MLLNKTSGIVDFSRRKSGELGQIDGRFEPELCFAVLSLNMHPLPLTREEVETKTAFTKNCRAHESIIRSRFPCGYSQATPGSFFRLLNQPVEPACPDE